MNDELKHVTDCCQCGTEIFEEDVAYIFDEQAILASDVYCQRCGMEIIDEHYRIYV